MFYAKEGYEKVQWLSGSIQFCQLIDQYQDICKKCSDCTQASLVFFDISDSFISQYKYLQQ